MSRAAAPRIRILPPQIANQIAAGEVVERPASVVKELLENSLDAGACSIEVEIEQGGVHLIRIRDDGHGIHRDDLILALAPHATSKIDSADDLEGVVSLGFRGEALASIASVSRLQLASHHKEAQSGWCVRSNETEAAPHPLPSGTELEVRDLFYNTPARRKFLRSERTEFLHVEEVVRRIALSRFDLALRFLHNGKQLLRLKPVAAGAEGTRRVAEVLGAGFVEKCQWLDVSAGGYRLWGWLGADSYSRSQSDMHYFYLNGRMIRDRLAGHAVRLAFGERIPEGRFPAYLLYLELDPRMVDVNVHPTKHEVRFRGARQVHDFIYWAVRGAFAESERRTAEAGEAPVLAAHSYAAQPSPREPANQGYRTPLRQAISERPAGYGSAHPPASRNARTAESPLGRVLCQLRSGYLVAERETTTSLVDLRALLETRNRSRLAAADGEALLTSQPLLLPETLELSAEQLVIWRERGAMLAEFGFDTGWLGESLLVLRKVPTLVRSAAMPGLLCALTGWLSQHSATDDAGRGAMYDLLTKHALPDPLPAYPLAELDNLLREYGERMAESGVRPWRELQAGDWQRLFELLA